MLSAAIGLVFVHASSIAFAASPQADATDAAQDTAPAQRSAETTLSTVTVNADRGDGFKSNYVQVGAFRDQSVLDTPSTVNVMTRAIIDSQNAQTIADVLKNSAGVTRSQTNGLFADNLTIRGLAVENRSNYRLNGDLPVNNIISMPMYDKERVEVLKGSSALYYGFTSPGGVINLVTKRASSTPNLGIDATWDDSGEIIGHIDAGRQFGADNQFGLRVNIAGGDISSRGIDIIEGDNSFYSLAADWRASDRLTFYLDYEKVRRSVNEQALVRVPGAVDGVIGVPRVTDPSNYLSAGPWAVTRGDAENVLGKVAFSLSDRWAASLAVGRAETNRKNRALGTITLTDIDSGQGTLSVSLNQGERYVNDNYRFEVTGLVDTGPLTHEISVGAMRNKRYQNSARGDSTSNVYTGLQNIYDPLQFDQLSPMVRPAVAYQPQDAQDDGVYFFDRVRFGEQWQLIAGIRRSDYESVTQTAPDARTVYKAKENSPSASLIWQFRPDTSVYASYIEGLEEGGGSPVIGVVNPGEVYAPRVSRQREFGIKTEVLRGITASLAYFNIDVPTAGFRIPSEVPNLDRYVQSGESSYRGYELSVVGELTPELSLSAGGLWLDASQETAANPAQIGKVPDSTAERTYNAYLDYHPAWAPGFSLGAGSFYVGKRPLGPLEQGWLPGRTTHSASLRYVTQADSLRMTWQLNVDNLTDKKYWDGGAGYLGMGAGRTTSVMVKLDWL